MIDHVLIPIQWAGIAVGATFTIYRWLLLWPFFALEAMANLLRAPEPRIQLRGGYDGWRRRP